MNTGPDGRAGGANSLWVLGGLAIIALTAAAYVPVMGAGYIWDDDLYVTHNPILRDPAGIWKVWTSLTASPQFYPLVFSSFWVEVRIWGFNPLGFHLVNLALHAANAVLVWAVLARLGVRWAWAAGLVFALHPVHVESAAWIAERKNVLSGCLYLLAAIAYIGFDGVAAAPVRRRWGMYALSLACFALALTAKTVACSLPAAMVLVLWWKRDRLRVRDLLPLAPMFVLGLIAARTTVWVEKNHVMANAVSLGLTWPDRLVLVGQTAALYLWHLVWPADLIFMYPKWAVDARVWWQWLPSAVWAAGLTAMFVARGRIGKGPLTAMLFFAGTLLPALGFIDVYPMRYTWVEDHFQYLADIGPIALAVAGLGWLAAHAGRRSIGGMVRVTDSAIVTVLAGALGVMTFRQGTIYTDAKTLWEDTITRNPGAWMAWNNMGKELLVEGKLDDAERCLQRSLELEASPECMYNLAMINLQRERPLAALEFARRSAAAWPQKADAQILVAKCLWALDREPEALARLREGVERLPDSAKMRVALALALKLMGLPGVREQCEAALRLEPGNAEAKGLLEGLPPERP